MGKVSKFKDMFPKEDSNTARKAITDLYNAESGFVFIGNAETKKVFARFHNMAGEDISMIINDLIDEQEGKSSLILPDNKIIK